MHHVETGMSLNLFPLEMAAIPSYTSTNQATVSGFACRGVCVCVWGEVLGTHGERK